MGGIDLDPASYEIANLLCEGYAVSALQRKTGFEQPWEGLRVPESALQQAISSKAEFIAKLAESYTGGGETAATHGPVLRFFGVLVRAAAQTV